MPRSYSRPVAGSQRRFENASAPRLLAPVRASELAVTSYSISRCFVSKSRPKGTPELTVECGLSTAGFSGGVDGGRSGSFGLHTAGTRESGDADLSPHTSNTPKGTAHNTRSSQTDQYLVQYARLQTPGSEVPLPEVPCLDWALVGQPRRSPFSS